MSYYYTRTRINAQHYRDEADEPQVYLIRPVLGNPYLAPGVLGLPIICIVTNVNSLIQYAGGKQSPRLEICNYTANWHEAPTCFILTPGEFIVDYFLFFLEGLGNQLKYDDLCTFKGISPFRSIRKKKKYILICENVVPLTGPPLKAEHASFGKKGRQRFAVKLLKVVKSFISISQHSSHWHVRISIARFR